MKRGVLLWVAVVVGCSDPETAATSGSTSSESGGPGSSSDATVSVSATESATSTASTSITTADTTCADGCTTSSESSGETTTEGASSSTTEVGDSSRGTDAGSSEGPAGVCGDGVVEGNEACDDAGESATCDTDCTIAFCGDATHNATAGEVCDAGGESLNCDSDCTLPVCGDGLANASDNEACDDGGPSPSCDDDCTLPSCGDGNHNLAAAETCDDGDTDSGDGCSSSCLIEGDFGGACVVVDGLQWCFDNDNCGQACNDVCASLGLTIEPNDAVWFAAQDTMPECQAISDALGMTDPIAFDAVPLGCLEDTGLDAVVGGGPTGGLACSSDPGCPAAHRVAMDNLGGVCNLPNARRSICPCAGEFCGNGVIEGAEICDDGNQINNDGCTSNCNTGPSVCDGGVDPGSGAPYVVCAVDGDGAWVSIADANGGQYHAELICQELGYSTIGEWGGTCGNVCGYCEDATSCSDNGQPQFDFGAWQGVGNCGEDMLGQILCQTVQWTCV